MYRVTVRNGTQETIIHDLDPDSPQKLVSGSFQDEVNVVPSMSFSLYPQNAGYALLTPLVTEIEVYNTLKNRMEFEGCLRKKTGTMKKSGQIASKWTAEGYMGYLMDSVQDYHTYENTDVPDFLDALFAAHNAMVEPRKRIYLGQCDIHDTSSKTTAYRRTLEEIRELLVNQLGGEIRVRRSGGRLYFDYLTHYGANSSTKIELARNLQEIEVTSDPSNIITRLIPLGAKLNDETAERLTIASVNSGCIWIDDAAAYAEYGTYQCATQEWDDVTVPANLLTKAQEFLRQNNVRKRHYKLTALDLALIGLDVDSFTTGDSYKTVNSLMGIDDWLRVVKRNVNIVEPLKSTLEIGDKTEPLTVQANRTYNYVTYEVPKLESDVLTKAQNHATAMLGLAGNSYLEFNTETGEILIMNSQDKYGENTRVWLYNANGWGVSHSGYNGPYTMAATFDDGFVADFITTGTLRSIEIICGEGENPLFQVSSDGTVTASAITITGGRINITTSDDYYDALNLNCGEKNSNFTPLQTQFKNTDTKNQTYMQAGGFWAFADYEDHNGQRSVLFPDGLVVTDENGTTAALLASSGNITSVSGNITASAGNISATAGNISAPSGTVSAQTGKFETVSYQRGGSWYSLDTTIDAINSNIQTLWSAVFGSS